MKAHVIQMNDEVNCVVLGDELKAATIMETLKGEHYRDSGYSSTKFYNDCHHWIMITVDARFTGGAV